MLTQADPTSLDLMSFIAKNQSDRTMIVTIDTRDMLPGDSTAGNGISVTTTNEVPGTESSVSDQDGPSSTRQNIVIRGYSKTGPEAVAWYNKLYNSGLPTSPVLNGVERYDLPNGDEVYIFEVEIVGGGDLNG